MYALIRSWRTHTVVAMRGTTVPYSQTANEDPRKSEFESQRILNEGGGLS